jgi:hypothetical protein
MAHSLSIRPVDWTLKIINTRGIDPEQALPEEQHHITTTQANFPMAKSGNQRWIHIEGCGLKTGKMLKNLAST